MVFETCTRRRSWTSTCCRCSKSALDRACHGQAVDSRQRSAVPAFPRSSGSAGTGTSAQRTSLTLWMCLFPLLPRIWTLKPKRCGSRRQSPRRPSSTASASSSSAAGHLPTPAASRRGHREAPREGQQEPCCQAATGGEEVGQGRGRASVADGAVEGRTSAPAEEVRTRLLGFKLTPGGTCCRRGVKHPALRSSRSRAQPLTASCLTGTRTLATAGAAVPSAITAAMRLPLWAQSRASATPASPPRDRRSSTGGWGQLRRRMLGSWIQRTRGPAARTSSARGPLLSTSKA
mmetsp:Transcript_65647/g.156921  ORF Transcript_65647/g.156921 Transcript_65647/m.156921 type:complete len:290 (+) Transcript_65647:293-1162(+)